MDNARKQPASAREPARGSQAKSDPIDLWPKKLPPETIILGFTGSLGSGCTFLSEEVARLQDFLHYELSTPIRDQAKAEKDDSYLNKQRIGNRLRQEGGLEALAVKAIKHADETWEGHPYKGLILSGIRNMGEVRLLRQFPNFFLFSIHAGRATRLERLTTAGKVTNDAQFDEIDRHDSEEKFSHGQQVKRCNYAADVIFNNDDKIPSTAPERKEQFVREKFVQKYVSLIQRLLRGEPTHEYLPSVNEAFMTLAYCESTRSACLKRKVGAIIALIRKGHNPDREYGTVIASGHNDVPDGQEPCVFARGIEGCYRDKLQERYAKQLKHCPGCGSLINKQSTCANCQAEISEFVKSCPSCGKDPEIECLCSNSNCEYHSSDLYSLFVPGSSSSTGKLLDMCRALHGEENAIISLARNGCRLTDDAVLFTTTFPCNLCANKIAEVGIKKVVYAEPYPMPEAVDTLKRREVEVEKFEGVKSSAFFRLYQ
ncbi:MAG: hypothetical protein ABFC96_13660 [Thermoguttaceae bacterium]